MSQTKAAPAPEAISEEFKKATDYALTDNDIERAKKVVGIDLASRDQEQIGTASDDNIRTFAFCTGSDNPLHCDPDYAATTRWGSVIAPSMMAGVINRPLLGDPPSEEYKANTKSLFRGVHVFISGGEWTFYKPIFPGDSLYSFRGVVSVDEQPSEFAGRKVNRITRDVKVNQRGEVVSTYAYREIMTERKTAREKGKNLAIEPAKYTDEDLARIDAVYAGEKSRGAEKRYWDSVEVGEQMTPGASGPLTVTDVVNFHGGGYGWVPYGLRSGRLWYKNRNRIAPFYVKDANGIPDVAQRLHWDNDWATAIGNPRAYDYGVMRENYIYRFLNDWAGDDAWVVRQYDEIRKFNLMGDTQFITGEVVGKRQENGRNLVDLKVIMTNQRGEETVRCEATIALPDRDGVLLLPTVPDELQYRASKMMARHWQLLAKKKRG
jgi:acyl dehydratase